MALIARTEKAGENVSKFTIKQIPIGIQLRLSVPLVDGAEVLGVAIVNSNPHLLVQEPVAEAEKPAQVSERRFVLLAVGREYEPAADETLRHVGHVGLTDSGLVLVLYEIARKRA